LKVSRQSPIPVHFRDQVVGEFFADLVINDCVILELKTARTIDRTHEAQLLHYLKATNVEVGLLLNFGERPQFKRLLFDNSRKKIRENPCKSVASFEVSE
jgi:GxxExxY protein